MKRLVIVVMLVSLLAVVAAACAKPAPTPTPTRAIPTPTQAQVATPSPTQVAVATPTPSPTQVAVATPTPAPTTPPAKVYTFTVAVMAGWDAIVPVWPTFNKLLDERSQGRIQMKVFEGGEHPLGADDYAPAVRDRLFDMSYQDTAYLNTPEPLAGMLDLPMLLAGGGGIQEYHDMLEKFRGETYDPVFDKYNMIPVFNWSWGVMNPTLRNKLTPTVDSLRGVKMRTVGKQMTDGVAALGAVPASMSWEEFMSALQRGVVDGWIMDISTNYDYATFEPLKYYTYMSFQQATGGVGINKDAFKELPQDLQDIFKKTAEEINVLAWENAEEQDILATWGGLLKYGVTFGRMAPSEERKAAERMKPLWDEWVAKVGPQGPDLLKRILAYHEEWVNTHK
ncbi:MAG: TRAP transporter substrate-binding protein DctP [Chloroflexi bacterium]|nr:TRAP transporter substrate-binding protein DctP [Chloroflexota bacterium]